MLQPASWSMLGSSLLQAHTHLMHASHLISLRCSHARLTVTHTTYAGPLPPARVCKSRFTEADLRARCVQCQTSAKPIQAVFVALTDMHARHTYTSCASRLTSQLPPPSPPPPPVCKNRFTEADLRLFPTVCRFDAVYAGIFKCGRRRVADYPHLQAWLRDVWQIVTPGGMQVGRACVRLLSSSAVSTLPVRNWRKEPSHLESTGSHAPKVTGASCPGPKRPAAACSQTGWLAKASA